MTPPRIDGRIQRGEQTRRVILRRAADIASVEGLEGLSIGRLAGELQISKSGVFTHFGAKEELQLATVRAAAEIYTEHVLRPALAAPRGLPRVQALFEAWLVYMERRVFPGGCFFQSAWTEYGTRPGRIHDALVQYMRDWHTFIERVLEQARDLGELDPGVDVPQLAFELHALGFAAGCDALLFDSTVPYERCRRALLSRLRAVAKDPNVLGEC
jgi:AcrR family transcriptional regulator